MKTAIIIPARKGSKGLPRKNQLLLDYTLSKIPPEYHEKVIVTKDDIKIVERLEANWPECHIHRRSDKSAIDTASTRDCLTEVVDSFLLDNDIIMLYLTYPDRQWETVMKAYEWFVSKNARSLLCREPVESHPYLCFYDIGGDKGKQIVEHDLCRRQDYPKCFKSSHLVSIFKATELKKLNKNLYNNNTLFFEVDAALDVDTPQDFEKIKS